MTLLSLRRTEQLRPAWARVYQPSRSLSPGLVAMAPARLVRAVAAVLSLAPVQLAQEGGEGGHVPSSGEFQGIPACVEPGDEAAELRNCLFGMERILSTPTHRVPCYEYHRGTRSDDYHPATQEEENEEGSHMGWYFNATTRKCVPVAPGECVACIPFVAESGCTDACGALESAEELELEREAEFEEEMLETWEVVYHFSIAVYVCFALALLCDDFFVASLDVSVAAPFASPFRSLKRKRLHTDHHLKDGPAARRRRRHSHGRGHVIAGALHRLGRRLHHPRPRRRRRSSRLHDVQHSLHRGGLGYRLRTRGAA